MPGTGRCILPSYHHYHAHKRDFSTAKSLGLGVCCVLSMYGAQAGVEDEHAPPQPFEKFKYKTMGHQEQISKFCEDNFEILPSCGRPQWVERACDAVCSLSFSGTLLLPNLDRIRESVIETRQALAESLFDTSPMRKTALKIIQNNIDQIRCAVTNASPWEENSMNTRFDILDTLEQCEVLCACTPRDSWNERVKAILGCLCTSPTPELWSTMNQLLMAAESIVAKRCFSKAESKTLSDVYNLAFEYDRECAAQCAKVWSQHSDLYKSPHHVCEALQLAIRASAASVRDLPERKGLTDDADLGDVSSTTSCLQRPNNWQTSCQCIGGSSFDSAALENSNRPQADIASGQADSNRLVHKEDCQKADGNLHGLHESCKGPQSGPQSPRQKAQQLDGSPTAHEDLKATFREKWLSRGARPKELFPTKSTSFFTLTRQASQEQHETGATSQSVVTESASVKTDSVLEGDTNVLGSSATDQKSDLSMLERLQQRALALINTFSESRSSERAMKTADAIPRMLALGEAQIELSQAPATLLEAQSLTILDSIRSSLFTLRRALDSKSNKRFKSHLSRLIFVTSRLWHLARLANPGTDDVAAFQLEEITQLIDLNWTSMAAFVAFETYASLVKEVGARTALDDFVAFISSASYSIDLQAAKLCLLILLYVKHGNVEVVAQEAQNTLSKLIIKLRRDIFSANLTEIPIHAFPEFTEFCSAYFGADACQTFDWRASLRPSEMAQQDVQVPLIKEMIKYGTSFVECLAQISAQMEKTKCMIETMYVKQVDSLRGLHTYLLSLESPEQVFEDSEVLAALEQTSAFAEACLKECEVDGLRAHDHQRQILEGTMYNLQWFRLLSTHLRVTPPSVLQKSYDDVAKAWILKSLWSHKKTASMKQPRRAVTSSKILSALASDSSDDVLVTCVKAFLDQSVPSRLVRGLLRKVFFDREKSGGNGEPKEYTEALYLLAEHCRAKVYQEEILVGRDVRDAVVKLYSEAMDQARRVARKATKLKPSSSMSR
eukprot:Blabericola_migrator_1__1953@NODE_1531_length_4335_cov_66_897142_g1005_i0_p1_GENE_NODE_1531_length_4335_cov_66_897142_g1005_i0NODE_1531_length_4335_cov_66_897142_g1005_i0_p1_ORF_typecomplete_len1010_score138_77_NODE_1531_length_4335_cov_66_897142_g1005_i03913420